MDDDSQVETDESLQASTPGAGKQDAQVFVNGVALAPHDSNETDVPTKTGSHNNNPMGRPTVRLGQNDETPRPPVVPPMAINDSLSSAVEISSPKEELGATTNQQETARSVDTQSTFFQSVMELANNGQVIIGEKSKLNDRRWWDSNPIGDDPWFKLSPTGPTRDLELDHGGVGALRVMAMSARGTKHQFYGEQNQDSFRLGVSRLGLVAAVADGVSSSSKSAVGSKLLCRLAVENLVSQLDSGLVGLEPDQLERALQHSVQFASDNLLQMARLDSPINEEENNPEYLDYSSTLTLMFIPLEVNEQNNRNVIVGFVGDSPCYSLGESKWSLHTPDTKSGEIVSNVTSALPLAEGTDVVVEFAHVQLGTFEKIAIMSDGVSTSLSASGESEVGRALSSLLGESFSMSGFIRILTFDRRSEDDDRTIVVVGDVQGFRAPSPNESQSKRDLVMDYIFSSLPTEDISALRLANEIGTMVGYDNFVRKLIENPRMAAIFVDQFTEFETFLRKKENSSPRTKKRRFRLNGRRRK